jgi:hypothetical protein
MTVKLIRKDFSMVDNYFHVGRHECHFSSNPFKESPILNEVYQVPDNMIFIEKYDKETTCYYDVEAGTYDSPPNFPCLYFYKNNLYGVDRNKYSIDEATMMIKEHFYKQNEKFTKLQKEIELFEKIDSMEIQSSREPIPESVRFVVWRRDEGKCVKCGSNKGLEFDHIIPFSKGGSSTERNLQLLCEKCNREKSSKI